MAPDPTGWQRVCKANFHRCARPNHWRLLDVCYGEYMVTPLLKIIGCEHSIAAVCAAMSHTRCALRTALEGVVPQVKEPTQPNAQWTVPAPNMERGQ